MCGLLRQSTRALVEHLILCAIIYRDNRRSVILPVFAAPAEVKWFYEPFQGPPQMRSHFSKTEGGIVRYVSNPVAIRLSVPETSVRCAKYSPVDRIL